MSTLDERVTFINLVLIDVRYGFLEHFLKEGTKKTSENDL